MEKETGKKFNEKEIHELLIHGKKRKIKKKLKVIAKLLNNTNDDKDIKYKVIQENDLQGGKSLSLIVVKDYKYDVIIHVEIN